MRILTHVLALLVLLDSPSALTAAKKHRHQNHAAAAAADHDRALQDVDAVAESIDYNDLDAVAIATPPETEVATPTLDCVQCTNIPTKHMLSTQKACATYSYAFERRCGTEVGWWGRDGNPEYCQFSCWTNGAPYASQRGAPCCERDDVDDVILAEPAVVEEEESEATSEATDNTTGATTTPAVDEAEPTVAAAVDGGEADPPTKPPPDKEQVFCAADVFVCSEDPFVSVSRDPANDCAFPPCPPKAASTSPRSDTKTDNAADIEESDNEMATILSEIAEIQEVIDMESGTTTDITSAEEAAPTSPVVVEEEEEEEGILHFNTADGFIDLKAPIAAEKVHTSDGTDISDISDEVLKETAEELAIVEDVVDELESETDEPTMIPATDNPTMLPATATDEPSFGPTTPHPTLFATTTFDIVDGEVVVPKYQTETPGAAPVVAPVAEADLGTAPVAAPVAEPVAEAAESEPKETEPHPYAWLVPTFQPTITFSPTPHHVWLPPTPHPTNEPTVNPTLVPTTSPTKMPTGSPSHMPTDMPVTSSPTSVPSPGPSMQHSDVPSVSPTPGPTGTPSARPSSAPVGEFDSTLICIVVAVPLYRWLSS